MRDGKPQAKLRCAVYTRKSTEDGLEQEFNSLDAQYEACAAYIMSQRHEGWTLVSDRYDDGGFSGGNLERPGLKRLLADIAANKVDVIVLYKIDRLTRSLADFAKIVEVLDAAQASFVSITQAFNTTTSMGRLMLNVLLSFAQFEREVTGERIRDKIAASKRKGLWMGGPVPLGYDVRDRKIVVNRAEAELVRHIMQRYVELPSVNELIAELERDGCRTKIQQRTSGPHRGGCLFRRGTLYHLLANRIYRGEIVHKSEAFPGEHEPIIAEELWTRVQNTLALRSSGGARRSRAKDPSLLVGLIADGLGRPMTPSRTNKGTARYRYYVTRPDELGDGPAWRVSARDIETLVCGEIGALLTDAHRLCVMLDGSEDALSIQRLIGSADLAAAALRSGTALQKAQWLEDIRPSIQLGEEELGITIMPTKLLEALGEADSILSEDAVPIILMSQIARVRRGHEIKLVISGPVTAKPIERRRDPKLVALVAESLEARDLVMQSDGTIAAIAKSAGRCRTRLTKLISLSCLAPDIVTSIVEGRQPPALSAKSLSQTDLPISWADQRRVLGFA